MRNKPGAVVTGEDFFDREDKVARFCELLEAGNSIHLSAPRRVGKSSLVGEAASRLANAKKPGTAAAGSSPTEEASEQAWVIVKPIIQGCTDEVQLIRALLDGLAQAGLKLPPMLQVKEFLNRRLRPMVQRTKVGISGATLEVQPDDPEVWRELTEGVHEALRQSAGKRVLMVVDELPVCLLTLSRAENGRQRVAALLERLRGVRQATEATAPWIVLGSVGLESLIERWNLEGSIADLKSETLEAYSRDTAMACLRALGAGCEPPLELVDAVCADILDRVGWPLPYYLQLFFSSLLDLPLSRRMASGFPTLDDVATAYEDLLRPHNRRNFSHWDGRLNTVVSDTADEALAREVLKATCRAPDGRSRDRLLSDLMARHPSADPDDIEQRLHRVLDLLERDGYLDHSGDTYAFRSFLLREYWRRRYA